MSDKNYIHGFTKTEQDRLYHQAIFLEPGVFSNIRFPNAGHILEVGSGVGAQTQILLRRFPSLKISCLDASASQLERARATLAAEINAGRVSLNLADAAHMPFEAQTFNGAFLCWILEHVSDPLSLLKETRRCLKPDSSLYCTEVMNSTLFIWPQKDVVETVWQELNSSQIAFGGDPFVGAKMPNLLLKAGYHEIEVHHINYQYDNRDPKARADFLSYWEGILLSAIPALVEAKRLEKNVTGLIKNAFEDLRQREDTVFSYCAFQISAKA